MRRSLRLNPFFVRAGAQTPREEDGMDWLNDVLIPSSSGLELKPKISPRKRTRCAGLNPFFVRAGAQTA